ncbi:hypothetical protein ABZ234_04390 [Nocardiopsis sp. NPDC006198]|uniref:hypothetical protein n=1 Tax=Nocardiopsis sp. NPDC006198 TaxID=3154472 RepID=UPI0033A93F9C
MATRKEIKDELKKIQEQNAPTSLAAHLKRSVKSVGQSDLGSSGVRASRSQKPGRLSRKKGKSA